MSDEEYIARLEWHASQLARATPTATTADARCLIASSLIPGSSPVAARPADP